MLEKTGRSFKAPLAPLLPASCPRVPPRSATRCTVRQIKSAMLAHGCGCMRGSKNTRLLAGFSSFQEKEMAVPSLLITPRNYYSKPQSLGHTDAATAT